MRLFRILAVLTLCLIIIISLAAISYGDATLPITGLVYLGCGYNIFGEYAKPSSLKERIFNLGSNDGTVIYNGESYTKPSSIELFPNNSSAIVENYGEGSSQFLQNYNVSAEVSKGFLCWEDSLKVDFTYSQADKDEYYYHRLSQDFRKYTLRLPTAGSTQFKAMINPQFLNELKVMDPTALFNKYGTHYLAEVVMGARCDYNAKTVKSQKTIAIGQKIKACGSDCFKGIGADIKADAASAIEMKTYNDNTTKSINTVGGRSEFADKIRTKDDFQQWLESITTNNLSMSNFTPNSLKPIWDLCDDPVRRKTLEDAYQIYAAGKQSIIKGNQCISNLTIVFNDGGETVNVPQEYIKLDYDLNRHAGGSYLYLCYQNGTDFNTSPYPITDLAVIRWKDPVPAGYEVIWIDLNRKTPKGSVLYLMYKRDPNKAANPIRKIAIKAGKGVQADPGYSFVTFANSNVPADFNEHAGGDWIYLEYTTQLN